MNFLEKAIKEASQAYYSDGTSNVSDEEFDRMLDTLKEQDPDNPLLTAVGHGYDVNKDTTAGERVRHKYAEAGSLPKCHNYKEYSSLVDPSTIKIASLKLDGISVVLYYEKGKLIRALTRGNGITGIDITDKVKIIDPSLEKLQDDEVFTGSVRGEILMSYDSFANFKELHPDAANPRNSTAGLMNPNQKPVDDLRFLSIVVYTRTGQEFTPDCTAPSSSPDYDTILRWLEDNFNKVVQHKILNPLTNSTLISSMEHLRDLWYGVYPADGIVLADFHTKREETAILYDAVAYKFPPEEKTTTVKGVEWTLSKTKYLIPRINFESVELAGTVVSWCHGDNAKNILDRQIGTGAVIKVSKAGEIIPHMTEVLQVATDFPLPKVCPACRTELIWNGVHLACPNPECSDSNMQDLLIWCTCLSPYFGLSNLLTKRFLIDTLGSNPSIEDIYSHGRINVTVDGGVLYTRFVEMYNGLFDGHYSLYDAILALNIPRLSTVNAAKLAKYPDLVKDLAHGFDIHVTDSMKKDIGVGNMQSIEDNRNKFSRLLLIEDRIDWTPMETSCNEEKVVITGKLSMKRAEFEALLAAHGFKCVSSVSKDTLCLITDDPSSGSSKNKQADKLGVPKMTEAAFTSQYLS